MGADVRTKEDCVGSEAEEEDNTDNSANYGHLLQGDVEKNDNSIRQTAPERVEASVAGEGITIF